jgi:outer membrane protein TolC
MNRPGESDEPTPEFRAHLEWQIQTALRRESRLASPVSGSRRHFGAALVVIAALATGGIAGIASERIQDARQRNQLIEAARSEVILLNVRLELVRATYQDMRRKFDVGTVDRESLLSVEREMRSLEASLAKGRLDIEEIELTSAAPRNDLDAPLVGKRDFVRERLSLDMAAAESALAAAEQAVAQAQQRIDVGTVPRGARLQPEAELAQARLRMQLLREKLALRERYLKGAIKGDALASETRRVELTLQLARSQRELEIARQRVDEVRRLFEVGQGTELDLKRSEVDLLERQLEMKGIQRELDMIGAVKR